jgi:hypothetical protein
MLYPEFFMPEFPKVTKCLIIFMVLASNTVNAQMVVPDTAVIAWVNKEPVIMREFMQRANKERSQVIRFYRINYGCEYNEGFWSKMFDGKTPSEVLKKKTLDTLVQIKVQQIAAKNWGIMPDITYLGFLRLLEKENKRRLEARSLNKVIYGPVQYNEDVYFNYLFTNMVNQLMNILNENVFKITDRQLKEIYETDKERLYRKGYFTKIRLFGIKFKTASVIEENEKNRKEAYIVLSNLSKCSINEESCPEKIKEKYKYDPDLVINTEDIIFNDSVYSAEEDNTLRAMVKESAKSMEKGEFSKAIEFPDALYVIQVKEKRSLGYRNFEECKKTIRDSSLEQLYIEYINNMVLKANIELQLNKYNQIAF